ncbi:MAG: ABC transporter substrate-binding protein [Comamonadaceae bacterium]|nr:ABC transporter substrate-binding protein [Comamonadaceae bacterium]
MKMEALTQLHEGPAGRQEGLPDRTRTTRTASRWRKYAKENAGAQAARHPDRRRRPAPARRRCSDFAPYIAKIKASGADTVVTGNWGSDLTLLVKAANDAGLRRQVLHLLRRRQRHAHGAGRRACAGTRVPGRLRPQQHGRPTQQAARTSSRRSSTTTSTPTQTYNASAMLLARRWPRPRSTDPVKVAAALEGLKFKGFNGEVEMRKADHQLQQPLYIAMWQKADAKHPVQRREHRLHLRSRCKTFDAVRVEHAHHAAR